MVELVGDLDIATADALPPADRARAAPAAHPVAIDPAALTARIDRLQRARDHGEYERLDPTEVVDLVVRSADAARWPPPC
ncbi:MAG: hypothetical protein L0H64_06470 [Pseudonocardia sp.]|nr:hypothetical protein [Pseudonocardia sp.]